MSEAPWTIGRLLTWTTDFLRDKGAESPRLDAEVLLAHARCCPRIALYTAFDEPAPEELRERFRALVRQRAAGKPVAYLVGQREFFSLPFEVTPDVLIPRPETELLVVRALDVAKERARDGKASLSVADVGVGSGVLAVTLARQLPQCRVTAVDRSAAALAVAQRNAARHGVAERIAWVEGDVLSGVDAAATFDLIVSNPPYVTTAELSELSDDVRRFEPRLALDGGELGTAVIERLLPQAAERLRPDGWLLMEVSPTIVARVEQLAAATPGLTLRPTLRDLAGLPRVIQAQRQEAP
ncbi:MAG TPA: peptide chain release factor N(5)-glutamine methyltransferase [Lacipirellulaceae bacterium]|nr:peptide chain release factor N(5)-glutamine methyltransferase [Lacipirellulaceae bacterium]